MWSDEGSRLALLELWVHASLSRRGAQRPAWDELLELRWVRLAGRRGIVELDERHRGDVETLLGRVWPEWRDVAGRLERAGLSADERGWKELRRRERAHVVSAEGLPDRLNRRTATAMVGAHSKAALSSADLGTLAAVEITSDGLVRMRPSPGLRVRRGDAWLEASQVAAILGEVALSERALADGTVLDGILPRAVLSVENRGPYLDLSVPPGWAVIHAPGWDTAAVRGLMGGCLAGVAWLHFGDLDPEGVRIFRHLRCCRPDVGWVTPDFWGEYLAEHGHPVRWPDGLVGPADPALVRLLEARGLWLEQEPLCLDLRLPDWLENALTRERVG